jgi:ElaB/YqjD/DUF883 family membrane-anchored ribosome-binding protein
MEDKMPQNNQIAEQADGRFDKIRGQAEEFVGDFRERVMDVINSEKLSSYYSTVEKQMKEKPLYFVAGSALIGVCIGLMLRGSRSIEE